LQADTQRLIEPVGKDRILQNQPVIVETDERPFLGEVAEVDVVQGQIPVPQNGVDKEEKQGQQRWQNE
jgi:hypothetical protein